MPKSEEEFLKMVEARKAVRDADVAFARSIGAFVTEDRGEEFPPWEIAYIGITESGKRVRLDRICSLWRIEPVIELRDARYAVLGPKVVRIYMRDAPPGIIMTLYGQIPVQADGFIDEREFYFRSRGTHWSMSIGGENPIRQPDWYYEAYYGEWPSAGYITEAEAKNFIEEAADLFRKGKPSMQKPEIKK